MDDQARLDELAPDARAAVVVLFSPEGLKRLGYWRHLYVSGRLRDDSVAYYELECYAHVEQDAARAALYEQVGGEVTMGMKGDYYW